MTELIMLTRGLAYPLPLDVTGWNHEDAIWYKRTALRCFMLGDYKAIANRKTGELYLVRFWLSDVKTGIDGEEDLESGNSLMLHYILAPDEDAALHDHPWTFRSTILAGGYIEEVPWIEGQVHHSLGPVNTYKRVHHAGDVIVHAANDLHRIDSALPDTWSLVETGRRCRTWGFHPAGQPWIAYRDKHMANRPARTFLDPGG